MYSMKRVAMFLGAAALALQAQAQDVNNGIKMYNYKKYQSAEQALSALAASNAQANYYLGLTYLAEGDVAKASATFSKYPDDVANMSGMIRVAFASKDVAKGTQLAKDLAAKSKKKEWIQEKYAADAITYTDGGDYRLAEGWYKDALTKNDNAELHIGLGDASRHIPGGGGQAMDNYESVTSKDAKNSLAYSRIGDLWYEARNYTNALESYGKAKDADASNPLPYKALADAYTRSGRYKQALENAQRYIQLSDNTFKDRMDYMLTLYLAQSYCDAAKTAQDMTKEQLSAEDKAQVYGVLGFSQAECGDSIAAVKNIRVYLNTQRADKVKPGDYLAMGKLYMKLDQLDSAGYYYQKGISGDTARNKTDVYRQIADAFKAKKEYCKSAEWYTNLVKANPETQPADYVWRGIMYYYCKSYPAALDAFGDFATKYPDQPTATYWQGRTAAAIDSEATSGGGIPYFTKWLEKVGGDSYEKKNDLKIAYEYMLYYFYNKKDKENIALYKEKIKAIDPNDRMLRELDEMDKAPAGGAKKKPAPAKK